MPHVSDSESMQSSYVAPGNTVAAARRDIEARFSANAMENPSTEARWLIAHILNVSYSDIWRQDDRVISPELATQLDTAVARRLNSEPIQYIVGQCDFYNTELVIGPGTLIPRPETERLVDIALSLYEPPGAIADVCTGSGAIAIAIAGELRPCPCIIGTDTSAAALEWARRNQRRLAVKNVLFCQGHLTAPLAPGAFALITANPPYVSPSEYRSLPPNVRDFEPLTALVPATASPDSDGADMVRDLATAAVTPLRPGGWLVCEIGASQGPTAHTVFEQAGWQSVRIERDYAERDRILCAQKPI